MGSSLRYLGCALGFAFAAIWMTVGFGPAIVCVLLAGLGYGAVFMAERAQAGRARVASTLHKLSFDRERYVEQVEDASTPLAAEAEYGWPWPSSSDAEKAEQVSAL